MTIKKLIAVAAFAMLGAAPATAGDLATFPYPSKHNYCPAGTQPTVVGGVICCAQPTHNISYHQAMPNGGRKAAAPVRKVRHAPTKRMVCPVGEKGCYWE